MFSTGLGIQFIDPEQLTELGRAYVRQAYGSVAGLPGSWYCALFDFEGVEPGAVISPNWWTRDYSASHMQCLSPLRYGPGVEVRWRWRRGGRTPAPYVGNGWDVFQVEHPNTPDAWGTAWLWLKQFAKNDEGVPYASKAPEWPFGVGQFNGPPPGSFGL